MRQVKVWDQLLSINEFYIHGMSADQIASLMRGASGTEVMLGLETRRKRSRELKHVVLTRQLPSTFAPDFTTVSCQRHHGESELANAHFPHLRSTREHVRHWTDSLALLRAQPNRHDTCPDPHQPPSSAEPADSAREACLPLPANPAESRNEEAELLEMRSDLLERPRTYLIL